MTFQVKACYPKKNFSGLFLMGTGIILPKIFGAIFIILFKELTMAEQLLSGQSGAWHSDIKKYLIFS
jgi:hypothetical protein